MNNFLKQKTINNYLDINTNTITILTSSFSKSILAPYFLKTPLALSFFKLFAFASNFISTYEKSYLYFNIQKYLFIILFKNIIIIYRKLLIKIINSVYFNKLKKYSKV